ncbi:hypothetical protein [Octadecabacter sp. R77987]|uniref:hypothetical protein n=1 Tax=Octadecabacter sp. R77987 TaxID=3093874 RepID=UPI0036708E16
MIDAGDDLIGWMIALRDDPSDYAGKGGTARLHRDLTAWETAQQTAPVERDKDGNAIHPARHGMHFVQRAREHFIGYYGRDHRGLWDGGAGWGDWLEAISDSPDEALERVFKWLDLFIEIYGRHAKPVVFHPPDTRPFINIRTHLHPMRTDPATRPGDGSLAALQAHLDALIADRSIRVDEFAGIMQRHMIEMLTYLFTTSFLIDETARAAPPPHGVDALAQAIHPGGDPWRTYFRAVDRLYENFKGMGQSQGGTRSLIKG